MGGTSKRLWLVGILVLRFVIPEACTYSLSLCYEVGEWFIIDSLPYEWRSGTSDGLFLPIYPPRGMHSSIFLRGLINFCNKYMNSLWLMWVHGLYALLPFRNLLASTVSCIALSHIESRCKLCRCIQTPWYDMLYHTQALLYLPQNNDHTYLLWLFHGHSEIYCHATSTTSVWWLEHSLSYCFAWSYSWHSSCGSATVHHLSYMLR